MMQAPWTVLAWMTLLGTLTVALARLIWASLRVLRPRRFWSPAVSRDVEVSFEEWGPPRFRQALRVASCSVFDPASALACRRVCLDGTRRPPSAPFRTLRDARRSLLRPSDWTPRAPRNCRSAQPNTAQLVRALTFPVLRITVDPRDRREIL